MRRFALLIHDSPRGLHYDFFLEDGDSLKTWALPRLPEPGLEICCNSLADHRPFYLDYEGPVSGNRGTVTRWDQGTFSVDLWTDDQIVVDLAGGRLLGKVALHRQANLPEQWHFNWLADNVNSGV
jgi:hypothetical protein